MIRIRSAAWKVAWLALVVVGMAFATAVVQGLSR